MNKLLALVVAAVLSASAPAAENGEFEGKVVVEWLDDPFIPKMRLLENFAFRQANGKVWSVPQGQILDGRGMPPLFLDLFGRPFIGGFRKSAVVYDFATHNMTQPWQEAQRMFFEASVAEGVFPPDAKAMYLLLSLQGSRWEVAGSRCFGSCHGRTVPLEWRPVVDENLIGELLGWVRSADPRLEEIDRHAEAAIRARGPHIFEQPPCNQYSGSTRVRWRC
jgi:hypothetical protein